jgi:hypothetical protein
LATVLEQTGVSLYAPSEVTQVVEALRYNPKL